MFGIEVVKVTLKNYIPRVCTNDMSNPLSKVASLKMPFFEEYVNRTVFSKLAS
jgi:hypothetical protein